MHLNVGSTRHKSEEERRVLCCVAKVDELLKIYCWVSTFCINVVEFYLFDTREPKEMMRTLSAEMYFEFV